MTGLKADFVRRLITLALGGALLALAGCGQPPATRAHPALFVARDGDTTIWLLGTIHLLPDRVDWQTPAITRAINDADMIVTEIPEQDPAAASKMLEAMARGENLPPVVNRVAASERPALLAALDAADISLTEADQLDSWAVAAFISNVAAAAAGASRSNGVEVALSDTFKRAGKPHKAFETLSGQLALFDRLPEADQRTLLTRSIADTRNPKRGYQATLAAWASGDTRRIAASFDPLFVDAPVLEEALLTGRNRRWAGWIAGLMRQPGRVLVAVGAGHLAGPKSVIAMLAAQGIKVARVQ